MTSNTSAGWSRKELEAVASRLEEDLRSAGPRFSIGFTPVSESSRMVALVPPSEEPPIAGGPGSGGFIESVDLGDVDLAQKVDRLPAEVKRHLSWMHAALGEPADTAILLSVDGRKTMWLEFWSKSDHLEQVADLLEHVQNAVMETTHERWPVCPAHAHELLPRAHDEWIAWECPDTEEAIAPFGQLTSRSA